MRESIWDMKSVRRESINGLLDALINNYFVQVDSIPNLSKTFTDFIRRKALINKTNFNWEKSIQEDK
jgi:hypothetical protein